MDRLQTLGSYTVPEASADMIKNITVLPNHKLSLQLHIIGRALGGCQRYGLCGGWRAALSQTGRAFIRAGEKHRLSNPGKVPLEIIEVQLGELVDEEDIVRFDDVYGRK